MTGLLAHLGYWSNFTWTDDTIWALAALTTSKLHHITRDFFIQLVIVMKVTMLPFGQI